MVLEVKEDSVCILVEKSRQTEQFIPAVKELLIGLLLQKNNHGETPGSFRFNIAYYDKEPVFWANQVTQCTSDKANSAAQWIRSWTNSHGGDLGSTSLPVGPHTMMAIVAAFNDPFVGAIYLLTSSLPFDSANDLINHAKYASKDRPVHVVFLTTRSHVDERAMEILHLLSRKTDGSFRVAYYDENGSKTGRLIEVPPFERHRSKIVIQNGSESSLAVSPVPLVAASPIEMPSVQFSSVQSHLGHRFQTSPSIESYSDIVVKTPKSGLDRPNSTLGRDVVIHTGRIRHSSHPSPSDESKFVPLEDRTNHADHFFRAETTEIYKSLESDSARSTDMDDIKKEFADFYWRKQKREGSAHSPRHQPLMHSKSVEFESTASHARRDSLSPTPDSLLSSSDDDELLEKYSPKKATPREAKNHIPSVIDRLHGTPIGSIRFTPSSRPPTGRSSRTPVTIYSKSHYSPVYKSFSLSPHPRQSPLSTSRSGMSPAKPAWRPATARKHFITSPKNDKRMGTEDRSRAWMNRWMNDWVKKHEPTHGPNRTHAAVQVEVDKDLNVPPLQRSKSEPRKLKMTTYTQTPQEEKRLGEEMNSIRELLTHNNHLLDALSRSGRTPRKSLVQQTQTNPLPLRRGISHDFGRLNMNGHVPHHNPPTERIAVIGPSRHPVIGGLHQSRSFHEPLTVAVEPQWPQWEQGYKTRRDQLQNALHRKEDIHRQHEQACYKAMYQKLAGDITRRNISDSHSPLKNYVADDGEKIELIARLPYTDNPFPDQLH